MIPITIHMHQARGRTRTWRLGDAPVFKEEQHPRGKSGSTGGQFVKKGEEGGGKPEPEAHKPAPSETEMEPGYEHPIPKAFAQGLLKYGFRRSRYYGTGEQGVHIFRRDRGTGGDHVEVYSAKEGQPEWLVLKDSGTGAMAMRKGEGWDWLKDTLDESGFKARELRVGNGAINPLQDRFFRLDHEDDETGVVTMKHEDGTTATVSPPAEPGGESQWRVQVGEQTFEGSGRQALTEALEGPVKKAQTQARAKVLVPIVREQSIKLGWDPDRVEIVEDDYTFELGGRQRYAAGTAHIYGPTALRTIKVYAAHCPPEQAKGLISHEIMHQKFQAVEEAFHADGIKIRDALYAQRDRGEPNDILGEGNTLNPKYAKEYPFYARLQPILGTPILGAPFARPDDVAKRFQKDDGVTQYSRDWWAAYDKGEATINSAMHETLAEMNALRYTKDDPDGKGPWKALYQAVVVGWWEIPEAKERRPAARRARRQKAA